MNIADAVATLSLPPEAQVGRRVPKKLLIENSAPTPTDKRQINEGIEELIWLAALKPTTIGVPSFKDDQREYLEIAVLELILRPAAKAVRLVELVHRAIPYPVVLFASQNETVTLSLAHKRWAQGEADKVVLDGTVVEVQFEKNLQIRHKDSEQTNRFFQSLALANLPRTHLKAAYQGWMDRIHALQAARIMGCFYLAQTEEIAADRRQALEKHGRLTQRITGLRAQAERESQINRRVELNLEIKQMEKQLQEAEKAL